jgi:L-ascorbate metabolism protein UlaG (beta-lactamase superfamily)
MTRIRKLLIAGAGVVTALVGVLTADAWTGLGTSARGERLARMQASPEWSGGRFVNSLPTTRMDTWTSIVRWVRGADFTAPEAPLAVVQKPNLEAPPASGLRITWFGHSSMLVELDGLRFLTDPVWSERCSPSSFMGPRRFFAPPLTIEELPALDAVVLSHDHYDHLDEPTIRALTDRAGRFFAPLGVGAHLEYWGVAKEKIVELDWWQSNKVGNVEVVATPARHFSGRAVIDANATLWASWALRGPAHRVYFSGDTAMFPGFAEIGERLGPFDAAMIEVGAYDALWADVHLGPEQAVAAHRAVRGGLMIPVHWGTFDLALHAWTEPAERLLVAAKAAGVSLATPRPGQSIEPGSAPPPERWWPAVPWKTAAEHPVVSSGMDEARADSTATPAL